MMAALGLCMVVVLVAFQPRRAISFLKKSAASSTASGVVYIHRFMPFDCCWIRSPLFLASTGRSAGSPSIFVKGAAWVGWGRTVGASVGCGAGGSVGAADGAAVGESGERVGGAGAAVAVTSGVWRVSMPASAVGVDNAVQ